MNQRRWSKPILSLLFAFATLSAGGAQASPSDEPPTLKNVKLKTVKVGGKWRIAWDVRLGTVRGILVLKQQADQVTGTFEEYGKTYPLTGSLQGQAITFDVPFTGQVPYTIEFKGTVERTKMTGTSELKGGGHGFLGHAGEVDEPQRPWTATKGLKRPNDAPGKPPDDDD
ncbi:MAG: hypothetical protein WBP65_16570 [Candidatus Sulfotelmatobacter sp.]|jgi:hypothetical protein